MPTQTPTLGFWVEDCGLQLSKLFFWGGGLHVSECLGYQSLTIEVFKLTARFFFTDGWEQSVTKTK